MAIVCCNLLLGYTLLKTDAATTEVVLQVSSYEDLSAKLATCTDSTKTYRLKLTANISGMINAEGFIFPATASSYVLDLDGYNFQPIVPTYLGADKIFVFKHSMATFEITDSSGLQNGAIKVTFNGPPVRTPGMCWTNYHINLRITAGNIDTNGWPLIYTASTSNVDVLGGKVLCGASLGNAIGLFYHCGGELYLNNVLQEYKHNYTVTNETPATCTTDGSKSYFCRIYKGTKTEIIPATGHNYVTTIIDPTCTADGYTRHQCTECDYYYDDEIVPALGHEWGEWEVVTKPTTESEGLEQRECQICGEKQTRPIPQLEPEPDEPEPDEPENPDNGEIETPTTPDNDDNQPTPEAPKAETPDNNTPWIMLFVGIGVGAVLLVGGITLGVVLSKRKGK